MEIKRDRDKIHNINPYMELVGHSMFDGKIKARASESYLGVHEGKQKKITKEYKVSEIQDRSRYLKFYIDSDGLGQFVELSLTAQKVLMYLIKNRLEFEKDYIYITVSTIPKSEGMSRSTIVTGFYELLDRNWIARAPEPYKFWINVGYFSYGNREDIFEKHYDLTKVRLKSDEV